MEAQLADPAFYTKDPAKFNQISKDVEKVRNTLDEKEMRWLELEEMKDSLEN